MKPRTKGFIAIPDSKAERINLVFFQSSFFDKDSGISSDNCENLVDQIENLDRDLEYTIYEIKPIITISKNRNPATYTVNRRVWDE